ncbi:lipopolysaccharide 1,2-N-acetylglucosaminetransferase [Serratia liquefaciens]|jgi:glycogen synthase|uniref:glycosyltransferase family 4 protein n=1 Tax=Serratia liquefaciens TaxID=614 RepID=UPI00217B98A6|nr:glycosyltransferase family 4 protein [Serratia liquefaciens]CAI0771911.1 lipopolysaccharide 1,2-N-acetylglucosaminetransferase [Serratia liquefaciens]CAI0774588.1 lipopolysaccharide 1,2-N-acetylglucosaminetransferase [Serratia liquefaciens]
MKIAIINTLYHPNKVGGAEVSVQLLAEELVRKGHTVRVICLHKGKNREFDKINNVEIVYLPLFNIYWPFDSGVKTKFQRLTWHLIDSYNLVMKKLVSKEIDDFNPDVVHTNNIAGFSVSVWTAIKNKNKKLVHTSRDYYLFHPSSTMFSNDRNIEPREFSVRLWSFIKKVVSRKVDVYIGISNFIRKFHIDNGFFQNSKSEYIYNSVEKTTVDDVFSKDLRFGFIGRLTKDKGFDIYCELVDRLNKKYPNAKFYAAGRFISSESESELKVLANEKKINLLGFIPTNEFLAQVDVVILPIKWREPFGRVVLESVMANKIVITNAVGGISELREKFSTIYFMDELDEIDFFSKRNDEIEGAMFNYSEIADRYITIYSI